MSRSLNPAAKRAATLVGMRGLQDMGGEIHLVALRALKDVASKKVPPGGTAVPRGSPASKRQESIDMVKYYSWFIGSSLRST